MNTNSTKEYVFTLHVRICIFIQHPEETFSNKFLLKSCNFSFQKNSQTLFFNLYHHYFLLNKGIFQHQYLAGRE